MTDANGFRRGHAELPRRPKPVWDDWTTLRDEGSLQRPLSQAERICIAVAHAEPTHAITLTSKDLDHEGASKAFAVWLKQITRLRTRSHPFIYFGAIAQSKEGEGGAHIHLLAWEFLRESWVRDRAGFGRGHIRYLADPGTLRFERFVPVTYALGQHESVFGSTNHRSNEPLPKNKRAHLLPQAPTIAQVQPELLSGLQLAKDRSVSDIELLEALPILVRGTRGKRRDTGQKNGSKPAQGQVSHTTSVSDSSPSSSEEASRVFVSSTSQSWAGRLLILTVLCLAMAIPGHTGLSSTMARDPPPRRFHSIASGSAVPRLVIHDCQLIAV